MEKPKEVLQLSKLEAKDGILKIIHREDKAEVIHDENGLKLSGTITAPRKFLEERGKAGMGGDDAAAQQEVKRSHIVYNYRDLYIRFKGDENYEALSYNVQGQLTINPEIAGMKVNTKSFMNSKELSQHLRFTRYNFANREENVTIVSNLQSFKAKIMAEIEKNFNNQTGDKKELYDLKVLRDGQPLGFHLLMPLYIGQKPVKFYVEIMVEASHQSVQFWLESPELTDLLKDEAKKIIDEELKFFAGKGYVLIEQ